MPGKSRLIAGRRSVGKIQGEAAEGRNDDGQSHLHSEADLPDVDLVQL
jgi:hypothetical protein